MNIDWTSDARKIPDEVMSYIRQIAVHAVTDQHHSPELIAKIFRISRSSIYEWLNWYRDGGDQALNTRKAPGAPPIVTSKIDRWLKRTILRSKPTDHGYDTALWTLAILAALLEKKFGIRVCESTIANHLHRMDLSCQAPQYRAYGYNPQEVEYFLSTKWPIIQRVARKMGADIFFEDEAGVGIMTRSGRTWGAVNSPPTVSASDQRGGYNVLSVIGPAQGELHYKIENGHIASEQYIEFLGKILREHPRPVIIIADHASFHSSKKLRDFVRAHRDQIRVFFLPRHAPHLNPDEQVWNEIKHRQLGRMPIIDKNDLKIRLTKSLEALQRNTMRVLSFFHLKDTRYVLNENATQ
jgi:transposase